MSRWWAASFVGMAIGGGAIGPSAGEPRKMNVLFIIADDLNTHLGCYGDPQVKTPHIDRLAATGVIFDRAYCQYPLCNPSRTSFLTGKRPETTKVVSNSTPPRMRPEDLVFFPEHFRAHGYFTARVGKIAHAQFDERVVWDVSEDPRPQLQQFKGDPPMKRRAQDTEGERSPRDRGPEEGGIGPALTGQPSAQEDGAMPDGKTARRIVELLEQRKNGDKPFFIAAGFHRPHLGWVAPKKYFDLYPVDSVALPQNPPGQGKLTPDPSLRPNPSDAALSDQEIRAGRAAYFACVSFIDAQVGVIMDAVERLALAENTVIVFVSDHGFHLGEHGGMWRKLSVYEESARVPLIVKVPGKKGGVHSPRLVELVDLNPTLTELCGVPMMEGLEGTSMVPLLDQPDRAWKRAAFTMTHRGKELVGRSVRTEHYRYTDWGDARPEDLFDEDLDPHEWTNLAKDPDHHDMLEEMRGLLKKGWKAAVPEKK